MLEQHAEAVVRTHLIMLGEGVDTSFLFYAADFVENVGFGIYRPILGLDLQHAPFRRAVTDG